MSLYQAGKRFTCNMLIVVSDAVTRRDEADMINALLDEGLEVFHLRKPLASAPDIQSLIDGIKTEHRGKLSLHTHHQLADGNKICRLHYPEEKRVAGTGREWQALNEKGFHLSTSVHRVEDAEKLPGCFDYAFLGPVFDSISKPGYAAAVSGNGKIPQTAVKLIAIGGIRENNLFQAFRMGFAGVAVLGSIWQATDPVKTFLEIKKTWSSIAR